MKISIITLPSKHYLATGPRLSDFAQWKIGTTLTDADFVTRASDKFRSELRKHWKKVHKRVAASQV